MKTSSYAQLQWNPCPHTQTIIFCWSCATKKGGKSQCKMLPWVWRGVGTSHSEPQVLGRQGREPGWGPERHSCGQAYQLRARDRPGPVAVWGDAGTLGKEAEVCLGRAEAGWEDSCGDRPQTLWVPPAAPSLWIQALLFSFLNKDKHESAQGPEGQKHRSLKIRN